MSPTSRIDKRFIRKTWRKMEFSKSLKSFGTEVRLDHQTMECLKESYKSSIWKLEIKHEQKRIPIILKISKPLEKDRPESTVEKNIYRKGKKVLQPFMPLVYKTKRNVNGRDLWVFMEYIEPLKGRVQYNPDHFDKIIPTLAKLHSSTMNERFKQHERLFGDWLPQFSSNVMREERKSINKLTLYYLDEAMKNNHLKEMINPYYSLVKSLLQRGPDYFPEVVREGCSIIHGDLHTANMSAYNIKEKSWKIKFIDWEGAKYAPCWFDLVNLIGVFLAYRREWEDQEEAITRRCVQLYSNEMRRHGVIFKTDPFKLYQMAFLKRILEKGLYLQLNWAVTGKKEAKLLPVYLEKIKVLGKKLELY